MGDDADGPVEPRSRRAGDTAPVLRGVVDALIDGRPVSWEAAERGSRTLLERQMTRQVRDLAAIAAPPVPPASNSPHVWSRLVALCRAGVRQRTRSALAALRGGDAVVLAALAADVHRARSPRELAAALMAHLPAAIGSPIVAVVACDAQVWFPLVGAMPALPPDSAIASLLEAADQVVRVDADARIFHLLPTADRAWVTHAGVAAVVPLTTADGQPLAGVLVGPRDDGRPHTGHDCSCLGAAASMAAVAFGALAGAVDPNVRDQPADPEDLSFECDTCGRIADQAGVCACGGRRRLAALPACLHGAFQVQRRIGQGGMGVVYLARDLRLERPVALKTLPCLSPRDVDAIRAEARAMAALDHPQVAVLYGLEDWRGTPVLVVEYLPGGTLATRLATGALPLREALGLGISIADALAALHDRGWLHRDVKPSNIGFGRGGGPKLLDFGLTRWMTSAPTDAHAAGQRSDDDGPAGGLAGTPLYLSPEAIDGEHPGEHDDVWALSMVLVEMIAGEHPFRARTRDAVIERLRRRIPLDLHAGARIPAPVADVLLRALHPERRHRIARARELAAALRTLEPAS